jgi:hypothetical protein
VCSSIIRHSTSSFRPQQPRSFPVGPTLLTTTPSVSSQQQPQLSDHNALTSSIMCYQIETGAASSTESWRPCLTEQNLRLHGAVHVQVRVKDARCVTHGILTIIDRLLPMVSNNNTEPHQPVSAMNPMTERRKTCKTSPGNELHRYKHSKYTAAASSRAFSPCKNHYRGYQHPPSQAARTVRPPAVAVHDQTRPR